MGKIVKIEQFVDIEEGKQIQVLTDIISNDVIRIIGKVNMITETERGPMQRPVNFEINETLIDKAFDVFDEQARTAIEQINKEEEEASKIIGTDGARIPEKDKEQGIIVP